MIYLLSFILAITPLYIFRFNLFGIPTTFLEVAIYAIFFIGLIQYRSLVSAFIKEYKEKIAKSPSLLFFILFSLSLLISVFVSSDLRVSLGALKAWYINGLLVCALTIMFVKTKKEYAIILGGLTLGALLVSIVGFWQYATNHVLPDGRIASLYMYDNVFIASGGLANFTAMYFVPILVLQIGFLIFYPFKKNTQIIFVCSAVLELSALYFTRSYGGILGLLGGIFILGLYFFKTHKPLGIKKKIIPVIILLTLLIMVVIPQLNNAKFKSLLNFENASSSNARIQIWKASWYMAKDHLILGVGLNNFEPVYREYIPKVVFPPLEWLVPHAHNLYLSLWLETGILGLVSFLLLIWIFVQRLIKENNFLSIALLASLASILLHGLVDTPILKNDLAVVFWMLVGLGINARDTQE